jgi:hypothetical protein
MGTFPYADAARNLSSTNALPEPLGENHKGSLHAKEGKLARFDSSALGQILSSLSDMSESAAIIKPFFRDPLHKLRFPDTLRATEAEDKPLLGSKLSADFGAKTTLGFSEC